MNQTRLHHLHVREFNATLEVIPETQTPIVSINELAVFVTLAGLNRAASLLVPAQPVRIRIERGGGSDVRSLIVQADRLGISAQVRVVIGIASTQLSTLRVTLQPVRRWSPVDHAAVGIISGQIRSRARQFAEIQPSGQNSYLVDVRNLIQTRIASSGAPVRWNTSLQRVVTNVDGIGLEFGPASTSDA